MKLSIITTVYKAENDLPRLLESMMAQKSPELEFFLIDNGSPDRCGEICREYAKKDPRFTVYTLAENIGYIRARNLGIEVCDGDYIGFCDSDDYLEPGGYDRAVEKIKETDCDFYATAYRTIGTEPRIDLLPLELGLYDKMGIDSKLMPQLFGGLPDKPMLEGFMWKHILRRSIVMENGIRFYEPLKPYEDQLFNIDVMKHCQRAYIDDNVLYNYVVNEWSITAKMSENFDAKAEWWRIRELYEQKRQRCENELQNAALSSQALWYTYILILGMVKCHSLSRSEAMRLLNQWVKEGPIVTYSTEALVSTKLMLFTRWCLRHGQQRLLMIAIAVGRKILRT